ncbi:MAG: arginine--tRNA ligase, partial [Bacillota bacterium]|nr:arginine--tRNA ligase [Bacillota bacterium]
MDFKTHISNKISEIVKELDADSVYKLLEIPKDESMGDIAFPCFTLSKLFKKAPNIIASDLACKISTDEVIEKAVAAGGYLNFFYNRNLFVSELTDKVLKASDNYGKSCVGSEKTVIVEYSSPNIAKPFHIGHLFSTAVGSSLSAIYSFLGYKVERINHLGDWGTQFGKLICAYKMWGDKETVEKDPINEL